MELTIVIPCYNEAENIPLLIKSINNVYKPDTEIILVDNGSTDDTPAILFKELESIRFEHQLIKQLHKLFQFGFKSGAIPNLLSDFRQLPYVSKNFIRR